MDLTPVWWTPDFLPVWLGEKGNLFSCLRRITRCSLKRMLWRCMRIMLICRWPLLLKIWELIGLMLYAWVQKLGTGKRARMDQQQKQAKQISDAERIRRLEKENRRLREERDILRKAAKYFAEETSW